MTQPLRDLVGNLRCLARMLTFRPFDADDIVADFGQIALALGFWAGACALGSYPWLAPEVGFDPHGAAVMAFKMLCSLLLIAALSLVAGMFDRAGAVYVSLTLLGAMSTPAILMMTHPETFQAVILPVFVAVMVLSLAAMARVIFALAPGGLGQRVGRSAIVFGGLMAGTAALAFAIPDDLPFWGHSGDNSSYDTVFVDTEALYYAQAGLMADQTEAVAPGTKQRPDLFVLAVGGYAYERVFAREVDAVPARLDDHFNSAGRTIRLLNSVVDPLRLPLANRPNLDAAFADLARRMAPEDVAFLYLTSHGYRETFSLDFWELGTNDISARDLAQSLDASGLTNVIVMVSACYSGSFIDDLQAPDRMIVTAASAEATSFGCSDDSEWTWWGRAFFEEGLADTPDMRRAFDIARDRVAQWEAEAGYAPSEPQIWIGSEMDAALDRLLETSLAGRL